ncbi:MAG: XRE family transcriptional regulator [Candidatus Omnitrophota bacterium]|jgi:ribosome-binding protein aMBF1 (putative translation factor)|nr:MAG: XRE family transcriptional regulator [Candidatus Omnitrophota bacterium]
MKKRLIEKESCIIHANIPASKWDDAIKAVQKLGGYVIEESVPWREAFPPGYLENEPAVLLKGARAREELTQERLSAMTKIPRRHISEMENGKRPIGKENARKLAEALKTNYRVFL